MKGEAKDLPTGGVTVDVENARKKDDCDRSHTRDLEMMKRICAAALIEFARHRANGASYDTRFMQCFLAGTLRQSYQAPTGNSRAARRRKETDSCPREKYGGTRCAPWQKIGRSGEPMKAICERPRNKPQKRSRPRPKTAAKRRRERRTKLKTGRWILKLI